MGLQGGDRTWDEWVQQWMNGDPQGSDIYPWFYRYDGGHDSSGNPVGNFVPAPSWAVDVAACWVNNIRDMINLQNAIYFTRDFWNNNLAPYRDLNDDSGFTEGIYWGWNEVPVSVDVDTEPSLVTTYVISLPPGNCAAADPGGYQDFDLLLQSGSATKRRMPDHKICQKLRYNAILRLES